IYGQVLISLLPLYTDHRFIFSERKDSVHWIELLLGKIEKTIDEKDAGIWEFRNMENFYWFSNLFQWAGATAGEKMALALDNKPVGKKAESLKKRAAKHI